ncbi:transposase, partial [Aeribacillus pallidus]|uniref:transposase n=1 Tax=Aeribacillus pallidus TaxID=33936 RepID=UPI0021BBB6FF
KVEAESVFGHIKGNRSFRRFSLRGLDKVHVEFGIVALAHNILKVAGIRQLLSDKNRKNIKASGEKRIVFLHLLHFRDLSDSPFCLIDFILSTFRIAMQQAPNPFSSILSTFHKISG